MGNRYALLFSKTGFVFVADAKNDAGEQNRLIFLLNRNGNTSGHELKSIRLDLRGIYSGFVGKRIVHVNLRRGQLVQMRFKSELDCHLHRARPSTATPYELRPSIMCLKFRRKRFTIISNTLRAPEERTRTGRVSVGDYVDRHVTGKCRLICAPPAN